MNTFCITILFAMNSKYLKENSVFQLARKKSVQRIEEYKLGWYENRPTVKTKADVKLP